MEKLSPEDFGQYVSRKRGSMGIRAAAKEIGTSAATLSRIERGHLPDIKTLEKICQWLDIDVRRILGSGTAMTTNSGAAVEIAFKKGRTLSPKTAKSLANLIIAAHDEFVETIEAEGH